jgi:hypothetical protein
VSNDGNISDNLQDLLESSRRTHRRLFAAGRIAGLREAAEVARKFSNVEPGDICEVQAAEWQFGIAGAILALAESGRGVDDVALSVAAALSVPSIRLAHLAVATRASHAERLAPASCPAIRGRPRLRQGEALDWMTDEEGKG